MALYLNYRQANELPLIESLADWESAPSIEFASAAELMAEAEVWGLAELFYSGSRAMFPNCKPGISKMSADDEELIWELACEQSENPEDARTWPVGNKLLRFLTFWRLALNEEGSYLELTETKDETAAYLLASSANAERLAYEQFDRGERIIFTPPAE